MAMLTVQIEHPIRDYAGWRAAFDRDPARREASGVRRYRVYRPVDDEQYVIVELDFDARDAAERFLETMRGIWKQVDGSLIAGPRARIVDVVEEHRYGA
jgi:hypothetical protein